jgi:putative Mn2+ efflux pump MntP
MTAVFLVAVSVGLDNFAVAAAFGMNGVSARRRLQMGLLCGLFAGGMSLAGLLAGGSLRGPLGALAGPAGAALLVAVGCYGLGGAIRDRRRAAAVRRDRRTPAARDGAGPGIARLWLAAVALSIDSLFVGFALGAYRVPLAVAVIIFTVTGTGLTVLGLEAGRRIGAVLGDFGGMAGSLALIGVGIALGLGLL